MEHAGYIAAVVPALRSEQFTVEDLNLTNQPYRAATLQLGTATAGVAFPDLTGTRARWDEHNGWRLQLRTSHRHYMLHRGQDLTPTPPVVAAWIALALTTPELVVDRSHELPLTNGEMLGDLSRYALPI